MRMRSLPIFSGAVVASIFFSTNVVRGVELHAAVAKVHQKYGLKTKEKTHQKPDFRTKEKRLGDGSNIKSRFHQALEFKTTSAAKKNLLFEDLESGWEDYEACLNQSLTDCETCTSTVLSNASESCFWDNQFGLCDSWSWFGTFGTSNCDEIDETNITDIYWCGGCVEGGGAWTGWECLESCPDDGNVCYSAEKYPDKNSNSTAICNAALDDAVACWENYETNCDTCTGTTLSDGTLTCTWDASFGWCDVPMPSFFGFMDESGSSTCDDVALNISEIYWCGGCIDNGGSWVAMEGCTESCENSDYLCYSTTTHEGDTAAICDMVWADAEACWDETFVCDNCTTTTLSDGSSTCLWEEGWWGDAYCSDPDFGGTETCSE